MTHTHYSHNFKCLYLHKARISTVLATFPLPDSQVATPQPNPSAAERAHVKRCTVWHVMYLMQYFKPFTCWSSLYKQTTVSQNKPT